MAGNYPDVPSWRMAYDIDGTQVHRRILSTDVQEQLTSGQIVALNNESSDYYELKSYGRFDASTLAFIFPELRDLDAYWIANRTTGSAGSPRYASVEVSSDTTNGIDGTWTQIQGETSESYTSGGGPPVRTDIVSSTTLGIKAFRITSTANQILRTELYAVHLYGEPSPNENLQRLEIWHPTLDQRLGPADLDWGDVPRNTTEIREFRIKNMHPTLTANSVRAAMSILSDTTPSVLGQQAISQDGGSTWGAQQTLTSPLGPEAISPVLQIKRDTSSNATLSLWWYRLFADALTWT